MSNEKTSAEISAELRAVCNQHVVTESHCELSLDYAVVVPNFYLSAATTKIANGADPGLVRELLAAKLEYLQKTKSILTEHFNKPVPAIDDATLEKMADESMAEANKPHLQAVQ